MNEPEPSLRDTGLFIVLVILINGVILPGSASSTGLLTTFYLAFFVQAGLTLYDGSFGAFRIATWLLLIAVYWRLLLRRARRH
jgi:hypothetical protein